METKDLVLLMLIPIMMVSVVIYTDRSPSITGAAVAQEEKESNIIGAYSINPSFKARIDYNPEDEYKTIKDNLDGLIEQCKSSQNIEQCFKDKANRLQWNCQEPQEEGADILHDFIDKFRECISLEEDGVVCRFSLDEKEMTTLIGSFFLLLTSDAQRIKAEIIHGKTWTEYIELKNLVYTNYNERDTLSEIVNSVRIKIEYTGKKPIVEDIFAVGGSDNSKIIRLSKTFLLYKKGDEIKFVVAEAPRSTFEAPLPANKIIDLPRIKGMKFCAKSKSGNQIYAYDESDNTVKLRDIAYKFAVTFPNPPTPPPVQVLKAEDKQKAENSVILIWNKVKLEDGSDVPDFSHYNIYCSKNTLEDKSTKEMKIEHLKPTIGVRSDKNYDEWVAEVNKCGKENMQDGVEYYFAVTGVSKSGKESKAVKQATAKSIDDLAPGVQKIILINSYNFKEEGISSACINLPIEKDKKPGYIWVGFFAPENNEDEITDISLKEQLTYYLHFSKQSPITADLNDCSNSKKCVELKFVPKDDFLNPQQEIDLRTFDKLEPYNFEEGQKYCFTIAARDNNGNVIKTLTTPYKFEKPQQWVELESKPVTKGFFDEK